ncbi:MAG: patatin-like phospholipase family protein [Bradyrhizobium sp.]
MAVSETADRSKPALALSGGGFRATLYHLGALKRLNELGYLAKFERISSVSGGSIAAGMLGAAWPRLQLADGRFSNLDAEVIEPLRAFCRRDIDLRAAGWGAILPGKSIGHVLADIYDDLFGGAKIEALPDKPQFVFDATNLQTGRLVRIQKVRLADYTIGEIPNPKMPVALAVAASSAFPPVLSPVTIPLAAGDWRDRPGTSHFGDPHFTTELSLTDGGAYDNLGLETVHTFSTIVVSDAGAPFATAEEASAFWPKQAMRALDIATDQSRALRKRLLHVECQATGSTYAYAGIDSDPKDYSAPRVLQSNAAVIDPLARIRTRLNPFSDEEQGHLINWGWYVMDLAMRSHVMSDAPAPQAWPISEWPLERI